MDEPQIRFDDGAAYEDFMGKWSRLAGDVFLDWLAPPAGLRWVDVGCGNGAFTELLVERCAPADVQGIDPSEGQIAFARARPATRAATYRVGDAMALPYGDAAFDAAVMALVIFFVPDPAKGVAEMTRVVRPGGSVSAYAWDTLGGGFPFAVIQEEMAALGIPRILPPSVEASRRDALQALWASAGLVDIDLREIRVQRSFDDFEAFWAIAQTGPRIAPSMVSLQGGAREALKERVRARMDGQPGKRLICHARANAIRGTVRG
jgi:SAM-dependent methyltransferase